MDRKDYERISENLERLRNDFLDVRLEFLKTYAQNGSLPTVLDKMDSKACEMREWVDALLNGVGALIRDNERLRDVIKRTENLSEFDAVCKTIRDAVNLLQRCETIKKACEEEADYTLEKFAIKK